MKTTKEERQKMRDDFAEPPGPQHWALGADRVIPLLDDIDALRAENERLNKELDAGDSWAWIRRKFEQAGRNYRWFKPRDRNTDPLVGTRYEVMGWLHCIFGEADSSRMYLEICLEQQKRADDAEEKVRQLEALLAAVFPKTESVVYTTSA